jgi:hypothetical protein
MKNIKHTHATLTALTSFSLPQEPAASSFLPLPQLQLLLFFSKISARKS